MIVENNQYSVLDSVSVGICIIDKDYIVRFWNEFMEDYTGFSKDEIQQNLLFDVFPAFQNKIYEARINNIFNGWPPVILSSRLHTPFFLSKDFYKSKRYQDIIITPVFSDDNSIDHALITINDVTDLTEKLEEQKKLYLKSQEELNVKTEIQEKLIKSEKQLKELNSTKDKFFSLIAHDLISPFNIILGYSDMLVQSVNVNNFKEVEEFSQLIFNATKRTHSLLVNLLDWSRLQTGRISFNPVVVNVFDVINEILGLSKNSASQKEIYINVEIKQGLIVIADQNMLNTVFRNLISNAIKYTPQNGLINISALYNSKSEFEFSIRDTGVGIKSDDIDKIFSIDVNFSTTGTANETGTGLGLMLCKEFIERHKGKIWVESKINEGSNFRFTIPSQFL
jgi:signal transduction histidine kinase